MDIFNDKPKDWRDLQNKVAHVLQVCGYTVQTPKRIQTIRGKVEIDVYAKDSDMLIVCECKYWESKVPQNVIFAFRTVVEDIGANKGIIIAKNGFQSGAYKSAKNTNIELKKWEDFLTQYRDKYVKSRIKEYSKIKSKIYRVASDKSEYWDCYDRLSDDKKVEVNKYKDELLKIIFQMTNIWTMLINEEDKDCGWDLEYMNKIVKIFQKEFREKILSYYDFFEYINKQIYNIVTKIEKIYDIKIL